MRRDKLYLADIVEFRRAMEHRVDDGNTRRASAPPKDFADSSRRVSRRRAAEVTLLRDFVFRFYPPLRKRDSIPKSNFYQFSYRRRRGPKEYPLEVRAIVTLRRAPAPASSWNAAVAV